MGGTDKHYIYASRVDVSMKGSKGSNSPPQGVWEEREGAIRTFETKNAIGQGAREIASLRSQHPKNFSYNLQLTGKSMGMNFVFFLFFMAKKLTMK